MLAHARLILMFPLLLSALSNVVFSAEEERAGKPRVTVEEGVIKEASELLGRELEFSGIEKNYYDTLFSIVVNLPPEVRRRLAIVSSPKASKIMEEGVASIKGKKTIREAILFTCTSLNLFCQVRKSDDGLELYFSE